MSASVITARGIERHAIAALDLRQRAHDRRLAQLHGREAELLGLVGILRDLDPAVAVPERDVAALLDGPMDAERRFWDALI